MAIFCVVANSFPSNSLASAVACHGGFHVKDGHCAYVCVSFDSVFPNLHLCVDRDLLCQEGARGGFVVS
jgi:hypothetical protein